MKATSVSKAKSTESRRVREMYRKRLSNLMKKANELSTLTGADVYVVTGRKSKYHEYTSRPGWPVPRQTIVSIPIVLHPFPLLRIIAYQLDSPNSVCLGPEFFRKYATRERRRERSTETADSEEEPIRSNTKGGLVEPKLVRNLFNDLANVSVLRPNQESSK